MSTFTFSCRRCKKIIKTSKALAPCPRCGSRELKLENVDVINNDLSQLPQRALSATPKGGF